MMNTKKKLITVLLIAACAVSAFASDFVNISFDFGISTAIMAYGDDTVSKITKDVSSAGTRGIIGATADLNVDIGKYVTAFAGCDFMFDGSSGNKEHFNHIDLAFFPGVRIYPDLGGFNVSVAYAFGNRFDFYSQNRKPYKPAEWGSGLRVALEYNMLHGTENEVGLVVGVYGRYMKRGNDTGDHIFAVYCSVAF